MFSFSGKGRLSRRYYALFTLLSYFFLGFLNLQISNAKENNSALISLIFLILYFICIWLLIAAGTRRCHDAGKSGWYQLIPFYAFLAPPSKGYNTYGFDPRH